MCCGNPNLVKDREYQSGIDRYVVWKCANCGHEETQRV